MLFTDLVSWWYGTGWGMCLSGMRQRLVYWWRYFSIATLLMTLFSPWRQIVANKSQDRSFDQMMKDMIDNTVSRFVGFWVRLFVIIAGVIGLAIIFSLSLTVLIIWPFIPVAPLILIAIGVGQ